MSASIARRPWTKGEDSSLRSGVLLQQAQGGSQSLDWQTIADGVDGRSSKDCRKRWVYGINPQLKKGRWTRQEDRALRDAVAVYGTDQWAKVAQRMNSRSGDQCSRRWNDIIGPNVTRRPWSEPEDRQLLELVQKYENSWTDISLSFPGRTPAHCRNRALSLGRLWARQLLPPELQETFAATDLLVRAQRRRTTSPSVCETDREESPETSCETREKAHCNTVPGFASESSRDTEVTTLESGYSSSHGSIWSQDSLDPFSLLVGTPSADALHFQSTTPSSSSMQATSSSLSSDDATSSLPRESATVPAETAATLTAVTPAQLGLEQEIGSTLPEWCFDLPFGTVADNSVDGNFCLRDADLPTAGPSSSLVGVPLDLPITEPASRDSATASQPSPAAAFDEPVRLHGGLMLPAGPLTVHRLQAELVLYHPACARCMAAVRSHGVGILSCNE